MKNENGFVCVQVEPDMGQKIQVMATAVKRLFDDASTDFHFGKFNSIRTRKRRFLPDEEISYVDGAKAEEKYPALFNPIRLCRLWYFYEYHFIATPEYADLMTIRDLILGYRCKLYLTPSQARLWKKIQGADINLYLEAAK